MRKTYILDTSTIINDYNCIKVFEGNDVIIPITVLEELDHVKTRSDMGGAAARAAIRTLDSYFQGKSPSNGVDIGNDIKLFIDTRYINDNRFNTGTQDDKILSCAASYPEGILVSKDIAMRLRAASYNISVQDYKNDSVANLNDLYKGYRIIDLTDEKIAFNGNPIYCKDSPFEGMYPNECVQIVVEDKSFIYRKRADGYLHPIVLPKDIWGIKSKNMEQAMALDLLLDPDVKLVSLAGLAGSGKTYLSVGAGMQQVINSTVYNRMEFYKIIYPVGEELGFTPGTVNDKLDVWNQHIKDTLRALNKKIDLESFLFNYKSKISTEAISYIRGRSIANTYVLVDEVSNATKMEIKTVITRLANGSKIVVIGDLQQQDNTKLNSTNNGLAHVIQSFKGSKLAGHITLTKGERSDISAEAARLL